MTLTEPPPVGSAIPAEFNGIGYTKSRDGFPLEEVRVPVPRPAADQILIHVLCSSLNPLDYKLAELNFFGRTPPVVMGFDLAGIVVAAGEAVQDLAVGDAVTAMADSNGDGGWAVGGTGGYALARRFLAVRKPSSLAFRDAAVLPICFIAAFKGLYGSVRAGDTVYIPGGAGGVGHLAVQMAARALGAARVISSASAPESLSLARACGADHVFNYRRDDIGAEIAALTDRKGVDVVFDSTYNEASFVDTAKTVRQGGTWVVLGAGPGRTSRRVETESPVDAILAARGARHVNANVLRYFSEPATLDAEAKSFLRLGLNRAMEWAVQGIVVPHIGKVIDSAVNEINAELHNMTTGRGPVGKVAVIVDRNVAR
jgi:NADPH:quinone reductase-like Zn-dependent oxidoreductase